MTTSRQSTVRKPRTIGTRLSYLLLEGSYIPREYYVFDDIELIYLPIYKVASTTIKTALIRPNQEIRTYPSQMSIHHEGAYGHHFLLGGRRRRYFKFAFVRNPFERLVSCFEDRVRRAVYMPIGRYYFDSDYNHLLIRRLFGGEFYVDMSFREFVTLIARIPDFLADGHFKSQYAWTHRFKRPIPDYIGKLENRDSDWFPIAERFNLPGLKTRINASVRQDIGRYFTSSDLVEIAARRYRKDIVTFGYQREYERLLQHANAQS